MVKNSSSIQLQNVRLFNSWVPIALVFVASIMATGYLMLKLYMTTVLLVETTGKSFIQNTKTKSRVLDEFFVQRQNDIESLSGSSVFTGYHHSKSLGMSKEYGLFALALLIEEELDRRIESIRDSGHQVFVSGIYYDFENSEVLATSHGLAFDTWLQRGSFEKLASNRSSTPRIETLCESSTCRIFLTKPVIYDNLERGLLVLELSGDLVSEKVFESDSNDSIGEYGLANEDGVVIVGPKKIIGKNIVEVFGLRKGAYSQDQIINPKSFDPDSKSGESNLFLEKMDGLGWTTFNIVPGSAFSQGPSFAIWMTWFVLFTLSVILLIVLVFRSLKLRNHMFEQLKDAHNRLEARVEERTSELESANAELTSEIRERKQAQKKLHQQAQVLASITDSIMIISKEMKIIFANDASCDIFRLGEGSSISNDYCYRILKNEEHVCDECPVMNVLQDEKPHKFVTNYFGNDGKELWVYNHAFPYYDDSGELLGAILLVTDYTLRKEIEKALKTAKELAEAASLSKSEFLMRMSHEIRTPMYAILGTLDLVLDSRNELPYRDLLVNAKLSAESLQGILNDILDFSKMEAHKLNIENHEFSLRSLVESVMDSLSMIACEKNVELVTHYLCEVPDSVNGDSLRIRQILNNLVGNSLKFTSHGEIMLKVSHVEDEPGKKSFLFEVSDSGIGIDKDKLDKIFDPFDQAEGFIARTYGGTGLGLAITKSLVELMGGDIWVESEIGQGSSFKFRIPLEKSVGGSDTIDECQIVTEDEKILIVDDNRKSADTLKQNLEGIGFVADVESDSVRAEDRICNGSVSGRPYSYVFIDYEMPGQDGLTLLRSMTKLVGIKKVFMADLSQLLAINEARTLGAELFLAKPYKLREILDLFNTTAASEPEQQSSLHEQIDTIKSTGLIERAARPRRILLAEDNAVNQKLIQRTLERKNFVVTIVNNGKEAVEMYKSDSFDLILMDVQMPVMDGLSATRIIRDYEKTLNKRTPIVAMTAHAFQETQNECLEAGMDYYFSKPISGTSLTEKIDTILRP